MRNITEVQVEAQDHSDLIAEARKLIAHTRTYNFGMWSADKLAHEVSGNLADALESAHAAAPVVDVEKLADIVGASARRGRGGYPHPELLALERELRNYLNGGCEVSEIQTYTCQSCNAVATDKTKVKLLGWGKVGFIICKDCIKEWASD